MILGVPSNVPLVMTDLYTGDRVASLSITGTDVVVSRAGAAWATATGVVSEVGGAGNGRGSYNYAPVVGDVVAGGFRVRVEKTGYTPYEVAVEVEDAPAVSADMTTALAGIAATYAKVAPLPADPAGMAAIASAHGAGSFEGASAGATASEVDDLLTTRHGSGTWRGARGGGFVP